MTNRRARGRRKANRTTERKEGDLDGESERGDSAAESDESEVGSGNGAQEVAVAVKKLYNLFTGKPHPLTGCQGQRGKIDGQGTSIMVLYAMDHHD